jgi:DNA-binding protein YbaB
MTTPQLPKLPSFPALAASAREYAEKITAERVDAASSDGSVAVTATGAGTIVEVRVRPLALRQLDNVTLAERVREAVNAVLDRVDALRPNLAVPSLDGIDAKLELFEHRMDGLLGRLDRMVRDLEG